MIHYSNNLNMSCSWVHRNRRKVLLHQGSGTSDLQEVSANAAPT